MIAPDLSRLMPRSEVGCATLRCATIHGRMCHARMRHARTDVPRAADAPRSDAPHSDVPCSDVPRSDDERCATLGRMCRHARMCQTLRCATLRYKQVRRMVRRPCAAIVVGVKLGVELQTCCRHLWTSKHVFVILGAEPCAACAPPCQVVLYLASAASY